ncbi:hypothetical protein CYY_001970 [Polysphondylium violaceum]|uniref:Uncharacterized protein n=1 Tax=Polysphondylium violaceum TaxID=133409 RepID=A0A8J4PXG9_9MYCE|nr:hypothetical protein CYY_001970 [Polysphondylium violaceum]
MLFDSLTKLNKLSYSSRNESVNNSYISSIKQGQSSFETAADQYYTTKKSIFFGQPWWIATQKVNNSP